MIAPSTHASSGYIEGIQWRGSVSAAQKTELQFAQSVSQSFLGINLKCASCHDSFIDRWTLEDAYALAAVGAEQPLEIYRCDRPQGKLATPKWLFAELGGIDASAPREERLRQLAALMTHPENGRFTRTIVNRLWYQLTGHGIVHPLDAMQTEPWSEDLLDILAVYLTDQNYDLKSLVQLIATSQAYQSRSEGRDDDQSDHSSARCVPLAKRMTAEQFVDSIWQITGEAPEMFDAPVSRGEISEESISSLELNGAWISVAADKPSPGDTHSVVFRKAFKIKERVLRGAAVIACDAPFQLYVNSRLVLRGNGDRQLCFRELHADIARKEVNVFTKGKDSFVVVATPAESAQGVPELYFEARLKLENGEELRIAANDSWEGLWNNPSLKDSA